MAVTGNAMRGLLKTGVAVGAHYSRLDRVIGARRGFDRAPLVVGYHRVVEDFRESARTAMPSLLVSARMLEQQLDWIGQRYQFVSMDELGRRYAAGTEAQVTPGEKPLAIVTFDDGYRDVYEVAMPLLKRKGIPFTAYVVTDLVGTDRLQVHDELYLLLSRALELDPGSRQALWATVVDSYDTVPDRIQALLQRADETGSAYLATRLLLHGLDAVEVRKALWAMRSGLQVEAAERRELQSMDWSMLRDLPRHGGTVGSHTRSHTLLGTASEAVVEVELEGSRQDLERELGTPVRHLAYPDGSYSKETLRAAQKAGYDTACTTCMHGDRDLPALAISRRILWEHACLDALGRFSPAILSCQVNGIFDDLERCTHDH